MKENPSSSLHSSISKLPGLPKGWKNLPRADLIDKVNETLLFVLDLSTQKILDLQERVEKLERAAKKEKPQ